MENKDLSCALRVAKILVVDDERDLVGMLEFALQKKGYETLHAYDGTEAWEKIQSEAPDLIILDLMLPDLDGWEICRMVRRDGREQIRGVPILMLSARALTEDRLRGLGLGADDYMTKPFSLAELIIRVERILEEREAIHCLYEEMDHLRGKMQEQELGLRKVIHDLKAPLISMGASAKLLMKPEEKEEALEMLRGIYETSYRLSRRVEEILMFSASSFSGKKILMKEINLPLLADCLRKSFQGLAREKRIEMVFHPLLTFPHFYGDERWLERALENLLSNALKYTPEGGRVEMGGSIRSEENRVEIWVKDNGRGIFPEEVEQIFKPLQRGGNALDEPGIGLGLSLVKEVADLHGGEIQVTSEPGKGSVFSLLLPCKENHSNKKEVEMTS